MMPINKKPKRELLELIPDDEPTEEQNEHWNAKAGFYKLSREPEYLSEFASYGPKHMAICHDNGTFTCISTDRHDRFYINHHYRYRTLHLVCGVYDPWVNKRSFIAEIVGKTSEAVAETAAFFWNLKDLNDDKAPLFVSVDQGNFDFSVLTQDQLLQLFEKNPKRTLHLNGARLNVAQSLFLATRPDPIGLVFDFESHFEDGGEALVHALETRQSSFGTFGLSCTRIFRSHEDKLKRILQLTIFDKLILPNLPENLTLVPFSVPVNALDYKIHHRHVSGREFHSLDIKAKELKLEIHHETYSVEYEDDSIDEDEEFPTRCLYLFLHRVAELGHFEGLNLGVETDSWNPNVPPTRQLVKDLVCAITANQKLKYLDLSGVGLNWQSSLKDIFKTMENHEGLRLFRINSCDIQRKQTFSKLKQLLSKNRTIQVVNSDGHDFSDESRNGMQIAKLYSFNRFFCGSDRLVQEPRSTRVPFVVTALTESASGNFQRSAHCWRTIQIPFASSCMAQNERK